MPAFSGQQDVERRIDTFLSWRRARAVLGRTVADRNDLISFAGVHPDRVGPLPPLNDLPLPDGDTHTVVDNPAIIWHPPFPWPVPATTAATAWREYLEAGGTLPLMIIGRHADAVASAPSVSSVPDECSRIGGRWHTRKVLPGRRLDRLLDRAQILWNPSVADDGYWLVARALARGIPAVVADAPHLLNDGPREETIPMLRTYAAHDIVAAGAALAGRVDRPAWCGFAVTAPQSGVPFRQYRGVRRWIHCSFTPMSAEPHRIAVGVWIELPDFPNWKHQGITRVIGFLIEGAAKRGDIVWRVVAPPGLRNEIAEDLRTLVAREGSDWTLHCPPPDVLAEPTELVVQAEFQSPPETIAEAPPEAIAEVSLEQLPVMAMTRGPIGWSPRRMGQVLFVAGLVALPLLLVRAALRPVLRPITSRLRAIADLACDPVATVPQLADAAGRLPFALGSKAAHSLRIWAAGHAPPLIEDSASCLVPLQDLSPSFVPAPDPVEPQFDPVAPTPPFQALAVFANAHVPVQGWLVPSPNSTNSRLLAGPRAVLFPDALPYLMPMGWREDFSYPGSGYPLWRSLVTCTLKGATTIITFSNHVARTHGPEFFPRGVPVVVAPPAPPGSLPCCPSAPGAKTGQISSRSAAAAVLRRYARTRAWRYLTDFPFEDVSYVAVSTQDRPTKNVQLIVAALARLIRRRFVNCKVLMTTPLWHGAGWTDLPGTISEPGLDLDVVSMPGLPRDVHAALYHCAALAVHASFLEGIVGALPFFEAVSVGTPCLMANGPHVRELLERHELTDTVFDPFDADDLADLISRALARRDTLLASQSAVYAAVARRDWSAVAAEYATAAAGDAFSPERRARGDCEITARLDRSLGRGSTGARWANEGMQRLLGFLIEGAVAAELPVVWRVVVPRWLAAEAETDLRSLRATPGLHWTLHAPPTMPELERPMPDALPDDMAGNPEPEWVRELAAFADARVQVDGWLLLFPFLTGATLLARPYAVILPDAIPFCFPVSWHPIHWSETGEWPLWRQRCARVIEMANMVVTFSEHVQTEAAQGLFGIPAHRTAVVPHAQPDLRAHLPFLPADADRTTASRNSAARSLRLHAAKRGWRNLADFPFGTVDYVVVSSQDRQTKNIVAVVNAVARLLRRDGLNLKLLMTTPIHVNATWTSLPDRIASGGLDLDVLSLPDLPRDVHAALYHGASLAVHASFYEGGQAPFPFHQAVSIGTPCLIAFGPHTKEFLRGAKTRRTSYLTLTIPWHWPQLFVRSFPTGRPRWPGNAPGWRLCRFATGAMLRPTILAQR